MVRILFPPAESRTNLRIRPPPKGSGQFLTCGISLAQLSRIGRISPSLPGGRRTVMRVTPRSRLRFNTSMASRTRQANGRTPDHWKTSSPRPNGLMARPGTESSNPSPSSGESGANSSQSKFGLLGARPRTRAEPRRSCSPLTWRSPSGSAGIRHACACATGWLDRKGVSTMRYVFSPRPRANLFVVFSSALLSRKTSGCPIAPLLALSKIPDMENFYQRGGSSAVAKTASVSCLTL
jgi:hypothetical protein